jgi:hypothetical protein
MRVRILYTNGIKTYDIFWLTHDGRDVYCGNPGVDRHISYHESGKIHAISKGKKQHERQHVPLANITGKYNLLTFFFANSAAWFEDYQKATLYSGKKSDAVITIDSRTIPQDMAFIVSIGLLEAGHPEFLNPMTSLYEEFNVETKQIMIATNVKPWVYVLLYWDK